LRSAQVALHFFFLFETKGGVRNLVTGFFFLGTKKKGKKKEASGKLIFQHCVDRPVSFSKSFIRFIELVRTV
jgi:hypothetical protein